MPSSSPQHRRSLAPALLLAGCLALLASSAGFAQVGQVVEIAQVGQTQLAQLTPAPELREEYDWGVFIAAGFGLLGLYWIRRHISRL